MCSSAWQCCLQPVSGNFSNAWFAFSESASSDTPTLTLRGFTYQAVGQLAKRIPQLFQNNTDIAAQFFSALSVEPPGVRAALQEAVSTLALAYKGCSGVCQALATFIQHLLQCRKHGSSCQACLLVNSHICGVKLHLHCSHLTWFTQQLKL